MTGDDFIKDVKLRASIPVAQATFSDDDILNMGGTEKDSYLWPLLMAAREEYCVKDVDYDLDTTVGKKYRINDRAYNNTLRDVTILDDKGLVIKSLPQLSIDNYFESEIGFYIKDVYLFLHGVTAGSKLRQTFTLGPSRIILAAGAAVITNITPSTITVNAIPVGQGWTSPMGIDISYQNDPNDVIDFGRRVTTSGSVLTAVDGKPFDTSLISVGDYVTMERKSAFVQSTKICENLLAQRVAVKCLEALGALDDLSAAAAVLNQMQKDVLTVLTPRVQGEPKQIIPNNPLFRMDM